MFVASWCQLLLSPLTPSVLTILLLPAFLGRGISSQLYYQKRDVCHPTFVRTAADMVAYFQKDFWRIYCLWSSYTYLGYYCHKREQLMTNNAEASFLLDKTASRLSLAVDGDSMPLFSPPDLFIHGLFPRALPTALERGWWRYWELTSLGVGESRLTFPMTLHTVPAWLPCPLQTHRHPASPSVPFLAAT